MTKPDYTAFDAELLRLIKFGITTFTALLGAPTLRGIGLQFQSERAGYRRVIDRRLQALRKAGSIKFNRMLSCWEAI